MLRKTQERTFVPNTLRGKSKQSNGNTSDVAKKRIVGLSEMHFPTDPWSSMPGDVIL